MLQFIFIADNNNNINNNNNNNSTIVSQCNEYWPSLSYLVLGYEDANKRGQFLKM